MPALGCVAPWISPLIQLAASDEVKAAGVVAQVSTLKHAPPPSRKIISLSVAAPGLTAKPVAEPLRQTAPGTPTQVHWDWVRPVTAHPPSHVAASLDASLD